MLFLLRCIIFKVMYLQARALALFAGLQWDALAVPSRQPVVEFFQQGLGVLSGQALKLRQDLGGQVIVADLALEKSLLGSGGEVVFDGLNQVGDITAGEC